MAEVTHTGEQTGIEVKTGSDYGKSVTQAIPVAGGLFKTFDKASAGAEDGKLAPSEASDIASESSAFIQSCAGAAMGIASDPLGWLIGQGLNFLITVVQPLQDAIHFVSGDGPALSQAAGNFANIGKGIEGMRTQFEQDLKSSLQGWEGQAAETAGAKLGEFAKGIDGVAGQAADVSQLLQISSMIMTVIEDFIKALLTSLIEWLIITWIPALAAAVPTCGASTAAAGTATGVKAATTTTRATRTVSKLQKLLDKLMELLQKLRTLAAKAKGVLRKAIDVAKANKGSLGTELKESLRDTALEQVGLSNKPGAGPDKLLRNVSGAEKTAETDDIGSDQSKQETTSDLNL